MTAGQSARLRHLAGLLAVSLTAGCASLVDAPIDEVTGPPALAALMALAGDSGDVRTARGEFTKADTLAGLAVADREMGEALPFCWSGRANADGSTTWWDARCMVREHPDGIDVTLAGSPGDLWFVLVLLLPMPEVVIAGQTLAVAPEDDCSDYDRDDYRYPQTVEDSLIARMGRIYGPYTGTVFDNKTETHIEHMVALKQAHLSGACAWDAEKRKQFARDLDNLTLAAPEVNRDKSAKDPKDWLPKKNKCWYIARVAATKQRWLLTVDRGEAEAMRAVADTCESWEMM